MGECLLTRRGGGGSVIKSIQRGTLSVTTSDSLDYYPVTISSVDPSKCLVLINGYGRLNSFETHYRLFGFLANSTTLRIDRRGFAMTNSGVELNVSWQVIEFSSEIKSIQSGVTTQGGTNPPADITISKVDISKSFVYSRIFFYINWQETWSDGLYLKSSTALGYMPSCLNHKLGYWCVVEFK